MEDHMEHDMESGITRGLRGQIIWVSIFSTVE